MNLEGGNCAENKTWEMGVCIVDSFPCIPYSTYNFPECAGLQARECRACCSWDIYDDIWIGRFCYWGNQPVHVQGSLIASNNSHNFRIPGLPSFRNGASLRPASPSHPPLQGGRDQRPSRGSGIALQLSMAGRLAEVTV